METYKIEIFGEDDKTIQRMEEIIQPLQDLQGYSIKLLWIDGESETDEYSVFELQEIIDKQDGILIDYNQLENLCYKMQNPITALNDAEKLKLASIRNALPKPDANTLMQKVMSKESIDSYLSGKYNTIGGYVTRAVDSKHLKSYEDIYYGLRLDYLNDSGKLVNFVEDGSCGVIRFKSKSSSGLIIPGENLMKNNPYPFTAHGFTSGKNGRIGAPEWKFNQGVYAKPIDGAELWEVYNDGREVLRAIYNSKDNKFLPLIKKNDYEK